jgi:hypothetical protein
VGGFHQNLLVNKTIKYIVTCAIYIRAIRQIYYLFSLPPRDHMDPPLVAAALTQDGLFTPNQDWDAAETGHYIRQH